MKTVVVGIGNSDDKLSQAEWSRFVLDTGTTMTVYTKQVHFAGYSSGDNPWQNACWMADIKEDNIPYLRERLADLTEIYNQDSIALIVGETEFVSTNTEEVK